MKIGYFIAYSGAAGGVFNYSTGILNLLIKSDQIKKIFLFYTKSQSLYLQRYFTEPKVLPILTNRDNTYIKAREILSIIIQHIHIIMPIKYKIIKTFSSIIDPYKKIIIKYPIDIFHVPVQTSPVYGLKVSVIVTMHDVQELHYPEFFSSENRMNRSIRYKIAVDESDHIIVSFNHVKNDLVKYFGADHDKVTVASFDFSDDWFFTNECSNYDTLKKKYSLPHDFILYPAATWQHKNHIKLLEAISILKGKGKRVFLISTGNKTEFYHTIENRINLLDLKSNVAFLGQVPIQDLTGLYHATRLVVIPTLYEAGSGPLFEAMWYNVPVVCSNVTSLPESIGNDEFIYDPNDPIEIANLIEKGLFDDEFRKRNIDNSKKRIEYYKRLKYIDKFIDAYRKAIMSKSI